MFRKGVHKARIKHTNWSPWIDCMVEYVSDCRIYLYTNILAFAGTHSGNFKKNSYGYRYCFHSSAKYLENVIYTDHNLIGEL